MTADGLSDHQFDLTPAGTTEFGGNLPGDQVGYEPRLPASSDVGWT